MTIRELGKSYNDEIKRLFRSVFSAPPWNEDWSDERQLDDYLLDLTEVRNPLVYGLFEGEELIGISIGRIKHWCDGTEYFIEELCVRPDMQGKGCGRTFFSLIEEELRSRGLDTIFLMTEKDKPAYGFYKKIGFEELPGLTSFWKRF